MTANRSLDEFAGGESEAASDTEDGPVPTEDGEAEPSTGVGDEPTAPDASGAVDATEPDSAVDPTGEDVGTGDAGGPDADGVASVDPAGDDEASGGDPASTYVWTPGGGPCATCGEPAEERWRDGDRLVCGDCKEW